jgi:hypothetical protein
MQNGPLPEREDRGLCRLPVGGTSHFPSINMSEKSFTKQACDRIIETALEISRANTFIDALSHFGYSIFGRGQEEDQKEFANGIRQIRAALYNKLCRNLANGFMFLGVDNSLKDLAIERLEKFFGAEGQESKMMFMQFLENWGNIPPHWKTQDEKDFQSEIQSQIKWPKP